MALEIVITTIGLIALLESIIILLFPNFSRKIGLMFLKDNRTLRRIAFLELILAIVLILVGINI